MQPALRQSLSHDNIVRFHAVYFERPFGSAWLHEHVCVWGVQTTTGVQLADSHELFNMQQGTRRGGEVVLVNEDSPPQTRVNVPSVGSWGIPSFRFMFISISFRAVPFLVSGTARA